MSANTTLPVTAAVTRINRAVAVLAESGDPEAVAVAQRLVTGLLNGGPDLTFDACMDLPHGWRRRYRMERRDACLRELAQQWPDAKGRALVRNVAVLIARYATQQFARDRLDGRPSGAAGLCFDVLEFGPVPGDDRLRQILGA